MLENVVCICPIHAFAAENKNNHVRSLSLSFLAIHSYQMFVEVNTRSSKIRLCSNGKRHIDFLSGLPEIILVAISHGTLQHEHGE